jgi:hypothetical protein
MKSAAEPVGFTVPFSFVMLLSVLVKAMMTRHWASELVEVVVALWRPFRLLAPAVPPVKFLDELGMRLVAVLTLGVRLRPLLLALSLAHFDLAD